MSVFSFLGHTYDIFFFAMYSNLVKSPNKEKTLAHKQEDFLFPRSFNIPNIRNKTIGKVSNEIFKDKLKLGEEIVFTFDTNKKKVDIEIGERAMKAKYN